MFINVILFHKKYETDDDAIDSMQFQFNTDKEVSMKCSLSYNE